jgi:hypothetical protein
LKIASKFGTTTSIKIPAKYITDLDFADDIMQVSDDAINSQKQLDSVDIKARRVDMKINRVKTEFMMLGNWASPIELRVSTGKKKSSQKLQVFRILAAKLYGRF